MLRSSSTQAPALLRALLWQIPHIPKHSRIRAGSSTPDCLLSRADQKMRQTPKMTDKSWWPNSSEPICGSSATSPRYHPVDPSSLHSLCPQGPFAAESTTFAQVIICHVCPNFIYICFLQHLSPGSFIFSEVNLSNIHLQIINPAAKIEYFPVLHGRGSNKHKRNRFTVRLNFLFMGSDCLRPGQTQYRHTTEEKYVSITPETQYWCKSLLSLSKGSSWREWASKTVFALWSCHPKIFTHLQC